MKPKYLVLFLLIWWQPAKDSLDLYCKCVYCFILRGLVIVVALRAGLLIRDCGGPGLTATVDFLASRAAILPPERENCSIRLWWYSDENYGDMGGGTPVGHWECENTGAGPDTERESGGAQCEMITENTQNKSHSSREWTDTPWVFTKMVSLRLRHNACIKWCEGKGQRLDGSIEKRTEGKKQ